MAKAMAHPASRSPSEAGGRADGKDEGQQGRALTCRDDLAEHSGEAHQHPEDERQRHRQPRNGRGQGPQTDQHRPVHAETAVGQRPGVHVAGEVDHDQQGDRAEDREQRCLRPAADGEADRRRDGDDDGRAQRAPGTVMVRVAGADPIRRPAPQAGRRQHWPIVELLGDQCASILITSTTAPNDARITTVKSFSHQRNWVLRTANSAISPSSATSAHIATHIAV